MAADPEDAAHAELGFGPSLGRSPLRRVLARMLWPFLRHQVELNKTVLAELARSREALERASARLDVVETEIGRARDDLEHHTAVLVRHEEPLDRHEFLLSHLEPAFLDLQRAVDLVHDKVDLGQRQAFARYHEGIGPIQAALGELNQRIVDLELGNEERTSSWRSALSEVWMRLAQLDLFLTEARRAYPAAPSPDALGALPVGAAAASTLVEEAFRGPVAVIEDRARGYLEDLAQRPAGPVLDVGCGRGELLSVLAEAGIAAYGIDANREHVRRATAAGLDVRHEDARAHLERLEEASLGAIVAIHVVEHLSADELLELLALFARALRPGGLLVLETPNPENLVVAASTFYLDPSHTRPLRPELLALLVGSRGFDGIEIRRLARREQAQGLSRPKPDDTASETVAALVEVVNAHLFAPADYALIARRP